MTHIYTRWIKLIVKFVAGNGISQVIQLITGFLIIRWLSPEEYAYYTLAFSIQCSAMIFIDMGYTRSIIPLLGPDTKNNEKLSKLILVAKQLQTTSYFIVATVCILIMLMLGAHREWPLSVILFLLGAILLSLWINCTINIYTQILLVYRRIGSLYKSTIISALLRLLALIIISIFIKLHAASVAWVGAIALLFNGYSIKKQCKNHLIESSLAETRSERNDIIQYVSPLIPNTVFYALQSQILVFLASIFGSDQSIASIGALTRIALIFAIFSSFHVQVIGPWIAKQPQEGFMRKYYLITAGGICGALLVFTLGYLSRDYLLWILGEDYANLDDELVLVLIAGSISLLNGQLSVMHAARKWIYWWIPMINIPGTLIVQGIFIAMYGLNDTYSVLLFGVVTVIFNLVITIMVALAGFMFIPQK